MKNILNELNKNIFFKWVKYYHFYNKIVENKLKLENKIRLFKLIKNNFVIKKNNIINLINKENNINKRKDEKKLYSSINNEKNDNDNINNEKNDIDDINNEKDEYEKYIKSFYEIYDDEKDTYDCPDDILKFIKKKHMDIKIKIKCSSPRNVNANDIKNVINNMFEESELKDETIDMHQNQQEESLKTIYYLKSNYKKYDYPDKNVVWPNPILYNHRLYPFIIKKKHNEDIDHFHKKQKILQINQKRLESLWNYSSSFGIDWNYLDELYLKFKNMKEQHLNMWNQNKTKIMLYASKVCKRKLINSRKKLLDQLNIDYSNNIYNNFDDSLHNINFDNDNTEYNLLLPRSIFRKWTRTLYFYWKNRYMHYYTDTLCDYLKGEIVDLQLLREHNERNLNLDDKKMLTKHSYNLKNVKGSNIYVTRVANVKKNQVKDDEVFDFFGVGKNIYTEQKKK